MTELLDYRVDDEAVEPRQQAPSARMRELGLEGTKIKGGLMLGDSSVGEGPPLAPPAPRLTLRSYVSQLNPWAVAARHSVVPLLVISLVSGLGGADQSALFTLAPQMRSAFGYDLAFLTLFSSVVNTVTYLLAPMIGFLADRFSRVWMLRLGAILTHVSAIGLGFATGAGPLLGARTLSGLGASVSQPALGPLLADYYPPQVRGRVFAFVLQTGTLISVAVPVGVGALGYLLGWRMTFIVLGAVSTLAALAYFVLREPVRGAQDRIAMGVDAASAAVEQPPVSLSESVRSVYAIGSMRRLWYAQPFLGTAGFAGILVPVYFAEVWRFNPLQYGLVEALGNAAGVLAMGITGPLIDRFTSTRPSRLMYMLGAAAAVQACAVALIASAPLLAIAVAGAAISKAASLLVTPGFSPPLAAISTLVVPARVRGFGTQTLQPWRLVAGPITYVVLGFLASHEAHTTTQMMAFVPFLVVGAAIMASGAFSVGRDIKAALAAAVAEEESRRAREEGRSKLLVCRGVEVVYDGAQVLFGVDFDVQEGEIVALLGTNGSGKSTLLRAISGLQEASGGAIYYDGIDVTHSPPHLNTTRGVVMVPGGRAIFPTMTVNENLRAAARAQADDPGLRSRRAEVDRLFPVLRTRGTQLAGNLSGGEQQMLSLAQALLMKPRLLMIDELSLGLAPQVVELLLEALRQVHAAGTTIILVEQSVNVALTIAQRAVFMENGNLVFDGPTRELLARGDLVRSTFLGVTRSSATIAPAGSRARIQVEEGPARLLGLDQISVSFGGVAALKNVSLEVGPGEIVGLIGPNGAGKTTLFDVISGFVQATDGRIVFADTDVTSMGPDGRARLGLVRSFQNVRLFSALTVRENIAVAFERHLESKSAVLSAMYFPVRKSERKTARRVENLVGSLGLGPVADKFLNELSTGTRRIVDLACLLAAEPRLLLLDEPSSGLAQAETEELGPLVARIAREAGCSIMIIEHDLPLVAAVSTRMLAMEAGAVLAQGSVADVMRDPAVVRAYLGASEDVIARSGEIRERRNHG
ncbi:MAG: MFS transporter [Candidatus Dormibacteria bacterium]